MKKLLSMFLALVLSLSMLGTSASFAQGKPEDKISLKPAEYNLSECTNDGLTQGHFILATDDKGVTTLKGTAYLADAETVKESPDSPVFTIEQVKELDPDVLQFYATSSITTDDKVEHKLQVSGLVHKDRLVMIMAADGRINTILAGEKGDVKTLTQGLRNTIQMCLVFESAESLQQLLSILKAYVVDDAGKPDPSVNRATS